MLQNPRLYSRYSTALIAFGTRGVVDPAAQSAAWGVPALNPEASAIFLLMADEHLLLDSLYSRSCFVIKLKPPELSFLLRH